MHDIDTVRLEMETQPEAFSYEAEFEEEALLNEAEEELLAAELLGVASEAELDQFLGKLFKRIGRGVGKAASFIRKNAGPLGGVLKGIAKAALPTVGAALGSAIPIPGVGTAIGGALGSAASNLLEAELEGVNAEDREFEVAKRVVRLAQHTAKAGGRRPPTANRRAAILGALRQAMRRMRAQQVARARARAARLRRQRVAHTSAYRQEPPPPADSPSALDDATLDLPDAAVGDDSGLDLGDAAGADDSLADADALADGGSDTGEDAGEFELEGQAPLGGQRSGRWVRRGGKIVLLGV